MFRTIMKILILSVIFLGILQSCSDSNNNQKQDNASKLSQQLDDR